MTITFGGGLKVDAEYKGFTIRTDQPTSAGGEGSAPEPFSLLLASIGTCAGIYVLSFCQSRDIPTAGIRLTQRFERDEKTKRITTASIDIHLPADFPEKYRGAVVRAADQCAVKKLIIDPPTFVITAVTDT
jgi:ribosomal protein S12 methylthiotransferase accessory factor